MKVFIERSIQWRYTYDDIGVHAPTSVSEVGNRTTAEGKTYTANALNQYTQIDDFAPQYDADGNQTLIKTENPHQDRDRHLVCHLQCRKPPHPLAIRRHRDHHGL